MNNINPLGKTYKEYQEELEKVNLTKTEKIELGLVDDLAKATQKAENYIKKNEKQVKEFAKLRSDVEDAANEWKKSYGTINGLTLKIYQAVKDLGLSMKEANQNKDVKKGDDMLKKLEDFRDLLRKAGQNI